MDHNKQEEQNEGVRMSHVLFAVLIIHVMVIGGAFAYHWMSGEPGLDQVASDMMSRQNDTELVDNKEPATESVGEPVVATAPAPEMRAQRSSLIETASPQEASAPPPPARPAPLSSAVARVASPAPKASVSEAGSYKVVAGDNLYKIAKKNGVSLAALRAANSLPTDNLRIGQQIQIPGSSPTTKTPEMKPVAVTRPVEAAQETVAAATPPPASATAPAAATGAREYIIAKGDTLYGIARKMGTTPRRLIEANGITDPSKLRVGAKILVPAEVSSDTTPVRRESKSGGEIAMTKP